LLYLEESIYMAKVLTPENAIFPAIYAAIPDNV
jgi:hypothetical protein